eukprot:11240807-Ditylum_brightwellii.AAC.1
MDILENEVPKYWQDKMKCHSFDYTTKGQTKIISFCDYLEVLDPKLESKKATKMHRRIQKWNLQ